MLKNASVIITLCTALTLASCDSYKTAPGGLKYEILTDSAGPTGELGGFVMFDLLMKTSKDSVIQNTFASGQPIPVEIFKPTYKGCIYEAFQLLSEGDSARFVVEADSFFLKTIGEGKVPDKIDPKEQLSFTIKVRKVYDKAYVEAEKKKMAVQNQQRMESMVAQMKTDSTIIVDYLAKNKIKTQRTPQGVHLDFKKVNKQGINLIKGDSVKVYYVGRLLDGTEFDRSGDKPFTLALGYGQVIPGWEDALLQMKKGEKAIVYIPSPLAYGERGNRGIPPNSVLVFEIEVLD
ncbi:MAG TPA: FKBP-type peptidyl-prolyl cis-trans isomerase [Cytophagaceae bacterium]|jgi:FKBP-type peptidyl-prolyl cis-trans isomerase FkpA|nr:FKBP-type peptidyl-prolyl cis-trans isomerase [Cytophagaceae bacterium]